MASRDFHPAPATRSPAPVDELGWRTVIAGAHVVSLAVHSDPRGSLIALDDSQGLPFPIRRVFYIFDVPVGLVRGNHSVSSHLFLTAARGAVTITCANTDATASIRLDHTGLGLYLEPGIHVQMSSFSENALLMVASSETYADVRYFDKPMFGRSMER